MMLTMSNSADTYTGSLVSSQSYDSV